MNIIKKFPRTFWISNTVELLERWSWYGLFNVLAVYLTASTDTGALGFSQSEKGMLMGIISAMVYFLPVFTGAVADKLGYKRSLLIAFVLYLLGYFMMSKMTNYTSVFVTFGIIGLGAAIFKPIVSATISKTTTKQNMTLGFGIFYMMVNLGALIGPIFSSKLRDINWDYVFYSSMIAIILNFLLVIFFYKEPDRTPKTEKLAETLKQIIHNIFTAVKDLQFLIFLLIVSGFWTMYMQLFFTLPVFIGQWVDTSLLYTQIHNFSSVLGDFLGNGKGAINPEMILNMDAFFIVTFQIFISSIVTKIKPIKAMISGFFIAAIGLSLMFLFNNPLYIIASILIFSIGEMTGSPTITAYIGNIADKNKKALYMGMSFLPLAIGNFLGGYISGSVYDKMSNKINFIRHLYSSKSWNFPEITETFSQNNLITDTMQKMNMTEAQLTDYLWNTYQPYHIWYIFMSIGLFTVVALIIFNKLSKQN